MHRPDRVPWKGYAAPRAAAAAAPRARDSRGRRTRCRPRPPPGARARRALRRRARQGGSSLKEVAGRIIGRAQEDELHGGAACRQQQQPRDRAQSRLPARSGTVSKRRALNPRGERVHAEGRCAHEQRVRLARAAERLRTTLAGRCHHRLPRPTSSMRVFGDAPYSAASLRDQCARLRLEDSG